MSNSIFETVRKRKRDNYYLWIGGLFNFIFFFPKLFWLNLLGNKNKQKSAYGFMMLAHKYRFYILLVYTIKILAFKFWNLVTSGFGEAISNLNIAFLPEKQKVSASRSANS